MHENLKAVLKVLETIDVHGRENLRGLLACINTIREMTETPVKKGGEKNEVNEH